MSTEPKKKSTGRSRKLQSAEAAQSRKERYAKQEYEFTLADKVSYFVRKGGPWVLGAFLLIVGGFWMVTTFRQSVQPDVLSAEEEEQARQMISNAAKLERQGDDFVAAAELETLIKRFPNSIYRDYAEELLERRRQGKQMFTKEDGDDGLDRVRERERGRGDVIVSTPAGSGEKRIGRRGAPESSSTAEVAKADAPAAVPESKKVSYPPDQPVPATMEEALSRPTVVKTRAVSETNPVVKKLPDGFLIQGDQLDPSGWPARILCLADQSEMVFIPRSQVQIGNDHGAENERPAHTVNVPGFYIDRAEISLEQYQEFLKANPEHPKLSQEALDAAASPQHPVVGVTFADAAAYCAWAKKQLPTEVQWEKAARGPQAFLFPWGNHRQTAPMASNDRTLVAVLSRPADRSPYGIFDLGGNAAEWCRDWFAAYQESSEGTLSLGKKERVIRGGDSEWSSTWRASKPETATELWLGFRGVLEVADADPPVAEAKKKEPARRADTGGGTGARTGRAAGSGTGAATGAPAIVTSPAANTASGRASRGERGQTERNPRVTSKQNTRQDRDDRAPNVDNPAVVSPSPSKDGRGGDRDRKARNN